MFDRRLLANMDWLLLSLALGISLLGVISIYSASQGFVDSSYYWIRQSYWLIIGCVAMLLVVLVDFRHLVLWAYPLHIAVLLTLLVVLLTADGGGEADRWLRMGPIGVQPSEFIKLTSILIIACTLRNASLERLHTGHLLWLVLLLGVPFLMILRQPDLGTALFLPMLAIPLLFLSGIGKWILASLAGLLGMSMVILVLSFQLGYYQITSQALNALDENAFSTEVIGNLERLQHEQFHFYSSLYARLPAPLLLESQETQLKILKKQAFHPYISFFLHPYQQKRLITFLNPDHDVMGAGYHARQSLIAIGSGGWFGKGFLQSTQGSLNFLPARHTDFIFSIFAEEWGFIGGLILLMLYATLLWRLWVIATSTTSRFGFYIVVGITLLFSIQILINIGMVVGMLPVVGLPLPLFSYGGSALLSSLVGVGLVLNIRSRRFNWT